MFKIDYKNDNHANLHLFTVAAGMDLTEQAAAEFVVEEQDYKDRYKVSLGQHIFYVKNEFLPKFWLILSKYDFKTIQECIEQEEGVTYAVSVPLVGEFPIDETDPFYQTIGLDFSNVDERLSKLSNATVAAIQHMAGLVNKAQKDVLGNTDIVKDFDGILTFNSELGKDFKLRLCFDKIKPVDLANDGLVIDRTDMTGADMVKYLGESTDKILDTIANINELVSVFYSSKTVTHNEYITKYAEMALNLTILKAFLDQNIEYITFGGRDDWRMNGPDTPNNVACMKYLDEEIEFLIDYLDQIPKTEGVDFYSIDMDTYTIFGRNNNNHVVTPMLQGHTNGILSRYSRGFERLLSIRMGMSDNVHFFKA